MTISYETPTDSGDGSEGDEMPTAAQPSTPPVFTGFLELCLWGRMKPITRRLLSLPGGIHFRKFILVCTHEECTWLTMALVEECFHTLESLEIIWEPRGTSS